MYHVRTFPSLLVGALLAVFAPAVAEPPRTIPDPACAASYAGMSGVAFGPADPGFGRATETGEIAPADVVALLPATFPMRTTSVTFNLSHAFALHEGVIYVRPLDGSDLWREVGVPECLDGEVSAISVDGDSLLALDAERWIYTANLEVAAQHGSAWTRRWGPFFWTDFGMQMPEDALDWATSDLSSGEDATFRDRAGNDHTVFGILTVYVLRGDGRRITTLDPWLPSDDSREVCTPGFGTTSIAGMSASGSTVMIIDPSGTVFTRLYEFDVAGSNTVFYDYAWEDQAGVASPRVQLPAPDWVLQPTIPGAVTDAISIHKSAGTPTGRVLRVEGKDSAGRTGFWEKALEAETWSFVANGLAHRGQTLPQLAPVVTSEAVSYLGAVDDFAAEVIDFDPYCSPGVLRVHAGGDVLDLTLHSVDGLRQERRGRGLDGYPRGMRSAIEVPAALWEARGSLSASARAFLDKWFTASRFLDGPLTATQTTLRIGVPCWSFQRVGGVPDELVPAAPDMGAIFAGFMAAQEENRQPSACTAADGAP